MRVGVLGTGVVGLTIAAKLAEGDHEVMVGTRDVNRTLTNDEPGPYGRPPFKEWHAQHGAVKVGTFAEAAAFGEMVVNATAGGISLDALRLAGEESLADKVLIDVSNPLDFSQGMPPSLLVCNTDSLAEQIQQAFPRTKVVKTLNTTNANVMVNPSALADGDHHVFVSGNDPGAKAEVTGLLKDSFGWKNVLDLGDIKTARGAEMWLPMWLSLMGALDTPMFNLKIVPS